MRAGKNPILLPILFPFLVCALFLFPAGGIGAQASEAVQAFRTGRGLQAAGDFYQAIDSYLSALEKAPSYAEPMIALAECYSELEEYDQARDYALKAKPFRKGDLPLLNLEAFIRIGLNELQAAEELFRQVLKAEPNNLDARFGLAELDLSRGKAKNAAIKYEETLKIAPRNSRALLSLAVIRQNLGESLAALEAIETCLKYHADEPQAQFYAAYLYSLQGKTKEAERASRIALELSPGHAEARNLLASLLLQKKEFTESASLMQEAVAANRKNASAWYSLALARAGLGKIDEAITAFKTAVSLKPDDEIARLALENLIADTKDSEDPLREPYAEEHFKKGREAEERGFFDQALFEYRRGLRVYPYSKTGRLAYAELLRRQDYSARYLSELEFLGEIGKSDTKIEDSIENYRSHLADSVARRWDVDQFAVKKKAIRIAFFSLSAKEELQHPAADRILTRYLKDILANSGSIEVLSLNAEASSFPDAFRAAREAESDYFVLVSTRETERDIQIEARMFVGRTGSAAGDFAAYRTGNDRVKNTARRICELIKTSLPLRAVLLQRKQEWGLIDRGASDSLEPGAKFLILKKGSIRIKNDGIGFSYEDSEIVGSFELRSADEEVSEGLLAKSGFFDMINSGDELILAPGEKKEALQTEPEYPKLYKTVRKIK